MEPPSEVWWANISSSSLLPLVLPPVLAAPLGPVLAAVAVVVAVGHSAHDDPGHHHHEPHQHQQWTHASEVTHSKHSQWLWFDKSGVLKFQTIWIILFVFQEKKMFDLFLWKVCLKCAPELNSFKSLLSDSNKCYNKTDSHGTKADVKDYIQIGRDSLTFSRFLTLKKI